MSKVIYKNHLEELVKELSAFGRVVAPVERHAQSGASKIVFAEYSAGDRLEVDYPTTVMSPKEFLLPPEETLFEFSGGKTKSSVPPSTVIFGVSYADLEGLSKLKEIFAKPVEDETFQKRATATIIVGIDRFSPPESIVFDVYLQKVTTEKYVALAGSQAGQKILKLPVFKNEKVAIPKVTKKADALLTDSELPTAIAKSKNHPIWNELEEKCFACGICSFTCPLCYCFETEDMTTLPTTEPLTGIRSRKWSTCFSEDFAATAGHNFRPERKDRIYNWYYHKFVRMPKEHNFTGCVDCDRCLVFCPAKINFRVVLNTILKDYKPGKK